MFKEKLIIAAVIVAAGLVGYSIGAKSAEILVSPLGQHVVTAFERGPDCWVDLGLPAHGTDAPAAALFVELFEDRLTMSQFFSALSPVIGQDVEEITAFLTGPLTAYCGLAEDEQASS